MSHVTSITLEISDIDALEAACRELGLTFKRGQQTHRWYGQWVNDYHGGNAAYKMGINPKDYGKCAHAIEVPGSGYDVGVVQKGNGKFTLVWDFYGTGRVINRTIGDSAGKLMQAYGVCKATIEARKRGWMVQRKHASNGDVQLVISGV